jgi:hypothetical protein
MFGRRQVEPAPQPMDDALTFLTVTEAAVVRGLVREAFAERGLEVSMHPDHARDADGREFGLWNVAATCHNDDRGEPGWAALVAQHLDRLLTRMDAPDPFTELTAKQVREHTYLRLYERGGLPADLANYPHTEFAPGVLSLLAFDLPESVQVIGRGNVERFGGYQRLADAGIANLRQLPVEQYERMPLPGGGSFSVLLGESVFTASRALLMPQLARDLDAAPEGGQHGWLLSMPNRHQVCWHLLQDDGALSALSCMAVFTRHGFDGAAGPVSPHVYWWNGSSYTQLTHVDDNGDLTLQVTPELGDILEQLPTRS